MKRYEKYKPSGIEWIGEVPEHWGKICLLYSADVFIDGDWIESPDISTEGIRYITTGNIGALKYKEQGDGYITEETFKRLDCTEVYPGDILISRLNEPIGRCCIIPDLQNRIVTSVDNVIYRPKPDVFDKQFVVYQMNCYPYTINANLLARGTTMHRISRSTLGKINLILPPITEQETIAAYLDARCGDIDKVVATQEKRIALLNEMKQSIITQAVTRGLNPDAKMKDSGVEWIGMVPEHWEVKKLKFVSNSISKGAGITKEQVVEDGDTQCVRYGEIYTKYNHSFDSCVSATNKDLHPVLQYFGYGDILFTCTGELVEEIGKSVVYLGHERCLAGGDILVVSHNQDPSFLNYALNSYAQIQKSEGRAKLKVVHISTYDISNLLLALPPIEEQKQIADEIDRRCSSIDKQIGAVTRQIELLREYKQSLITDVVTGKVKVC